MKKGLIFLGMLILTGFGTIFLIRFLRDGDFYYVEFVTSIIGLIMICVGIFLKMGSNSTNDSY
jgi:uncharacterized membrane protein YczE